MEQKNCVFASCDTALAEKIISLGFKIHLFPVSKILSAFHDVKFSYDIYDTNNLGISHIFMAYLDLEQFFYETNVELFLRRVSFCYSI